METLLLKVTGLAHWEIALLATYLLLQGFVITIFPEEVITITLGLLWSQDRINFFEALIAIQCGLLPSNAMMVFLGTKFGKKLLYKKPFTWLLDPAAVDQGMDLFKRYGSWVVIVTRFIPIIRGPIYFAAGASQLGILKFMRTDALASCIQLPILLFLGAYIGKSAESLMGAYQKIGVFMGALLLSALLFKIFTDVRKRYFSKQKSSGKKARA